MKAKMILCPTDFSEHAKHALEVACSLARENDATVYIVHVDPFPLAASGVYYGLGEPVDHEVRKKLSQIVPADPNVRYVHKLLHGDPAGRIVDLAKCENADMIVMGTHGRTGLKRVLLGSVAEAVVRHAPCPVLTLGTGASVSAEAV